MSTRIQHCAWKRFIFQGKQLNHGKAKWQAFEWKILSVSCWDWMENQLNSSGTFSQDSQHCRFFTPSKATWRDPNIEPEEFSDRIIFMSMLNDIDLNKTGNEDACTSTSDKVFDKMHQHL